MVKSADDAVTGGLDMSHVKLRPGDLDDLDDRIFSWPMGIDGPLTYLDLDIS